MAKKFKVHILFGDDAVHAMTGDSLAEAKHVQSLDKYCCDIVTREFNTEEERNAYVLALYDSDGWFGSMRVFE